MCVRVCTFVPISLSLHRYVCTSLLHSVHQYSFYFARAWPVRFCVTVWLCATVSLCGYVSALQQQYSTRQFVRVIGETQGHILDAGAAPSVHV